MENLPKGLANSGARDILKGLEAISAGKEMEAAGVEVIISRRGTAHLLRENLHIPVLSIPLASLNILDCLRRAADLGKKILLTTFQNETSSIAIMEELLAAVKEYIAQKGHSNGTY